MQKYQKSPLLPPRTICRLGALLFCLFLTMPAELLAQGTSLKAEPTGKSTNTSKSAARLDPSVIDPVGKLAEISGAVSQSSSELSSISQDLDKLNNELSRVEKDHKTKVTKASLDALQKRFKETIDRSYVVEKRVKDSLSKSQTDIENVRLALTSIQKERASGAGRRPVMTDDEISECLKDLNDLSGTIKGLKLSLTDNGSEEAAQSKSKKQLTHAQSKQPAKSANKSLK